MIQAGINKLEGFNRFIKWIAFGGDGVIAENDRDQQRKVIAYNHLVSNCILFRAIRGMTNAIRDLIQEGFPIDKELISCLSPFITKHINRFGDYTLDLKRQAALEKYSLIMR